VLVTRVNVEDMNERNGFSVKIKARSAKGEMRQDGDPAAWISTAL